MHCRAALSPLNWQPLRHAAWLASGALALTWAVPAAAAGIRLQEPSKLAYRCGNSYTDNEAEALARQCKLISAGTTVLDLLNANGRFSEVVANGNLRIFVDKRRVITEGKLLKSWSVLSYLKPQPIGDGQSYQSVQSLEYYDCSAHTSGTKRQVYYQDTATQTEVLGSLDLDLKLAQDPPGSMGARVQAFVCDQ